MPDYFAEVATPSSEYVKIAREWVPAKTLLHLESQAGRLWSIVGLPALASILLDGLTGTPAMRWLDRRQGRDPDAGEAMVQD